MKEIVGINEDGYYVDADGNRTDDTIRMSFQELTDAISNDDNGDNESSIPFEIRNQMLGYLSGTFQYIANFVINGKPVESISSYKSSESDDTFWKAYNAIDKVLVQDIGYDFT